VKGRSRHISRNFADRLSEREASTAQSALPRLWVYRSMIVQVSGREAMKQVRWLRRGASRDAGNLSPPIQYADGRC